MNENIFADSIREIPVKYYIVLSKTWFRLIMALMSNPEGMAY